MGKMKFAILFWEALFLFLLSASCVLGEERLVPPMEWLKPQPSPTPPGPIYSPPLVSESVVPEGAPLVYEYTPDAGPDETVFLVGDNLSPQIYVWGMSPNEGGQRWTPKVQFCDGRYLAFTLPESTNDGPFLVWIGNDKGWSRPIRLNVPDPWWCHPDTAEPGGRIRVFGRDLARRPDRSTAFVYLCREGEKGRWLEVEEAKKYTLTFRLPQDIAPGDYQIWVHAGKGGDFAWGGPLRLTVKVSSLSSNHMVGPIKPEPNLDLQVLLDDLAKKGGGVLKLSEGTFLLRSTLRIPAGVSLMGEGIDRTRLELQWDATLPSLGAGWGQGPYSLHNPGDTIEYRVRFPQSGKWWVWLRYATDMSPWGQPGVSGNMTLQVDDGEPVPLQNLPNTGSFATFKWSRCAQIEVSQGEHIIRWRNVKGGGMNMDAFVFALEEGYRPSENSFPEDSDKVVVLQAESVYKFQTKEGKLPGDRAVVWLCGDGASIENLSLNGNPRVNIGVLVTHTHPLQWIDNCRIERVKITDIEGKFGENYGVKLTRASHSVVRDSEIWARGPIALRGVRQCEIRNNRLVPLSLGSAHAEAAIEGRCEVVEECIIENNRIACPPGAEAGGPTTVRLVWLSTGRGSVLHNWIAGNGVEPSKGWGASVGAHQARFGNIAGEDQNLGEMILFEGNYRIMFHGPIADADATSITLPKSLPPTPPERLGSVTREQLAHDAQGNETPFYPPDVDDGSEEPSIGQYFVTILSGPGQGQTRRILRREGDKLILAKPWREPPKQGSVVVVGTGFYRNLIVDNYTPDGMTGIQLWIYCVENVIAGNTTARQRKPGIYIYSNATTLATSMPRTWNRGLSPLFFNYVEGNRTEECSQGILVISGDAPLPIEFPRSLGNVIRHNSFIRNRSDGVVIVSTKGESTKQDPSPSLVGTIVEFNVVRDAVVGYHLSWGGDYAVFRRNHAYFWYPVTNSIEKPIAILIEPPKATAPSELNSFEGGFGVEDESFIPERRAQ